MTRPHPTCAAWPRVVAGLLAAAGAISGCDGADRASADAAPTADLVADVAADVAADAAPDAGPDVTAPAAFARCLYDNLFSGSPECKEYRGDGWTAAAAEADCGDALAADGVVYEAGKSCGFEAELGRCAGGDGGQEFVLVLSGDDAGACGQASSACTAFLAGTFTPDPRCEGGGPGPGFNGSVFLQPFEVCSEPLAGEPPGQTAGKVCTQTAISGCTEPGRAFADYASCEVVLTQRPYYALDPDDPTPAPSDDPRLSDATYMAEVAWVREQVRACACVCCHSVAAPEGASGWDIDAGPLWVDTMPDSGVAMLAAFVSSKALGAYPASDNNGFSRDDTGLPSTDVPRMEAFWAGEAQRRGLSEAFIASIPPFGGPLVDQLEYQPKACANGQGVAADGTVTWTGGGARYVYVMGSDSANPGVPPNLDLPDGTLWRLDAAAGADPIASGLIYGAEPQGTVQKLPAAAEPAALTPGETYYLYVLADIAFPITRCLFVAPSL